MSYSTFSRERYVGKMGEAWQKEAWPLVRDADELHDVLLSAGALPNAEALRWLSYFEVLRSVGRSTLVERSGASPLWVATERWPVVHAIWPDARPRPEVAIPRGVRTVWPREEAVVQLVRGRIEYIGPTTSERLASDLGLSPTDAEVGLLTLETQGAVLRGRFTGEAELEWCDRRLLARIHRLTMEGLRRQIAPVSREQFMRFLVRYQHLQPETKHRGQMGLLALVEQLQGFEAPAGHWEKYILPARLEEYDPSWMDAVTFMGQVSWSRLRPTAWTQQAGETNGRPMKPLTRSTPISLMRSEDISWLSPSQDQAVEPALLDLLGSNARAAHEAFVRHGALFPGQIGAMLQMLPTQVEDVLGELASAGLVTSDGYPALRTLIKVNAHAARHRMRRREHQMAQPAGRWTLVRSPLLPVVDDEKRIDHWCRLLLRRYGVMFRDLIANESAAPRWGELIRNYRRLEARGEIRYGRFVDGVAGEQFALPETIPLLRAAGESSTLALVLSGTDPVNLTGRIVAGPRVPALPGHSITINNGGLSSAFEKKVVVTTSVVAS